MLLTAKEQQDMKDEIERLTKEDIEAFGTNETKQNGGRSPDLVPALIMVGSALYELHGFYQESLKNNPAYVEFVQYVNSHGLDAAEASGKFKALLKDNDLHKAVLQKTTETVVFAVAGAGAGKLLANLGPDIAKVVTKLTTGFEGNGSSSLLKKYFEIAKSYSFKGKDEFVDFIDATKEIIKNHRGSASPVLDDLVTTANTFSKDGKIFFEKGSDLIIHHRKHAKGIMSAFDLDHLTSKDYLDFARNVVKDGTYIAGINANIKRVVKNNGEVRYLIAGFKNQGNNISTFHVKRPADMQKLL